MATHVAIDQLRDAVQQATRRTVRRLVITFAILVMLWSAVIALAN